MIDDKISEKHTYIIKPMKTKETKIPCCRCGFPLSKHCIRKNGKALDQQVLRADQVRLLLLTVTLDCVGCPKSTVCYTAIRVEIHCQVLMV